MATSLDLHGPLYGKRPCPADEIWLNDSDIVLVPKSGILVADNIISRRVWERSFARYRRWDENSQDAHLSPLIHLSALALRSAADLLAASLTSEF